MCPTQSLITHDRSCWGAPQNLKLGDTPISVIILKHPSNQKRKSEHLNRSNEPENSEKQAEETLSGLQRDKAHPCISKCVKFYYKLVRSVVCIQRVLKLHVANFGRALTKGSTNLSVEVHTLVVEEVRGAGYSENTVDIFLTGIDLSIRRVAWVNPQVVRWVLITKETGWNSRNPVLTIYD